MNIAEAIDRLNLLAIPTAEDTRRLTSEELRELLRNPPERQRSVTAEETMEAIVEQFKNSDENTRSSITAKLTPNARARFLGYAATMAVSAVRQNSPELIEQGLAALVIEDGGQDWRDSLLALFQLYHSAVKLGMDAKKTFAKMARLAEPGVIKKEMHGFPLRPPESRSLEAFCMQEEIAEDGFRYRQIPWAPSKPAPARPAETPQEISARLTSDQQQALIGMASTLAAMAIKTQSPKLVEQGLHGLALGGGALDPSHSMEALAKLHDAALKLGMDAVKVFADAATLAPDGELKNEMIRFPRPGGAGC